MAAARRRSEPQPAASESRIVPRRTRKTRRAAPDPARVQAFQELQRDLRAHLAAAEALCRRIARRKLHTADGHESFEAFVKASVEAYLPSARGTFEGPPAATAPVARGETLAPPAFVPDPRVQDLCAPPVAVHAPAPSFTPPVAVHAVTPPPPEAPAVLEDGEASGVIAAVAVADTSASVAGMDADDIPALFTTQPEAPAQVAPSDEEEDDVGEDVAAPKPRSKRIFAVAAAASVLAAALGVGAALHWPKDGGHDQHGAPKSAEAHVVAAPQPAVHDAHATPTSDHRAHPPAPEQAAPPSELPPEVERELREIVEVAKRLPSPEADSPADVALRVTGTPPRSSHQ